MFTESLPSGRVRGSFKLAGRKFSRVFDYGYEAEAWAETAETQARAASALGVGFTIDKTSGEVVLDTADVAVVASAPLPSAPKPSGRSVIDYGREVWLEARRAKLSPNTVAGYATHLRSIGADAIAEIPIEALRLVDVDMWMTRQIERGDGRSVINARLKVLRMVLRYAVANREPGVVDATDGVDLLKTELKEARWITDEEDAAILAAARTASERAAILAGLDAGLRWEEVYGLGTNCLDGLGNVVVRQVVDRQSRTIRRTTKSGKGRPVPMTERLEGALRLMVEIATAEGRFLLFSTVSDGGVERPVDYWNWRRDVWRPICHAAKVNRRSAEGFVRLRFHDLRHTFGTRLAQAGVPSREIMELMGHADEKTTQRYTHAGNAARRAALLRNALRPEARAVPATVTPIGAQEAQNVA